MTQTTATSNQTTMNNEQMKANYDKMETYQKLLLNLNTTDEQVNEVLKQVFSAPDTNAALQEYVVSLINQRTSKVQYLSNLEEQRDQARDSIIANLRP